MFWDGTRWIDEDPKYWDGTRWVPERTRKTPSGDTHRRLRDWIATAVIIVGLVALALPFTAVSAAPQTPSALVRSWKTEYKTTVVQERSTKIRYRGDWFTAIHRGYTNDKVRASNDRGASASIKFKGTGISWVGPKGPTRGRAKVYVDGKLVKTVNLWQSRYVPNRVLFKKTWTEEDVHTLRISVLGTSGHPTVAIDAFVIRGKSKKTTSDTAGTVTEPIPSSDPTTTEEPGPTADTAGGGEDPAPEPTPSADPTATSDPSLEPPSSSPSPSPTDTQGENTLTITDVLVSNITETSARVQWTASTNATGQVEYGKTTSYGSVTAGEDSFTYSTHIQTVSGLAPGTLYHFRTHSVDQDGNAAYSGDQTFTTLAGASPSPTTSPAPTPTPTPAPTPTPTAGPTPTPAPTPTPTAAPTPTPAPTPAPAPSGACFGSCFAGDTLANTTVPGSRRVAYSFRATSSLISSIRVYWQGGSGYGAGTGGSFEGTIRPDSGNLPGSTVLGTESFTGTNPGNAPGRLITFSPAVSVTPGQLYWLQFRNIDPNPSANYSSANATMTYGGLSPRQPSRPDSELAVVYADGSTWTRRGGFTALLDVGYTDGTHSGMGYMEFWVYVGQPARVGGDLQAREAFTNPTARTVSTMAVRLERLSGSGALTLSLRSGSTLIAQGSVPASAIAQSDEGCCGGDSWAVVTLPSPVTLPAGSATLVLTAPSGTTYSSHGIRKGTDYGYSSSTYFAHGSGQYSIDGGSSWSHINGRTNGSDLQFYLR